MAIPVLCRDAQWFHMCPWQLPTPTPPAQSCVQSLQKSIKQWKRKEEASVARWMNYLCTGELLLLMWHCFFLIFPLSFCLKFYCCLTFFLYLFLTPFLSTVLVSTWPTFCILLSLSLPPSFFRISFLLLLEIFIHCFNFLTYFVPISFPVPFFLVCFSSFVCLCSALFYTAPFPPPLSHIPSPLFLISSCRCCSCRNLRHSQGGVKALHVSLPPCKRGGGCSICRSWDNGSCQQDVGVLFKCGNVPWKLGHLAPLHSMSDFSFICCCYEYHKHG